MFKTIFGLAFECIKRRKSQSILIFAVLLISFAFAFITLSYNYSIVATNSQYRDDSYGTWLGVIAPAEEGDLEYLESTDWLDDVGISVSYGNVGTYQIKLGFTLATINYSAGIGTVDDAMIDMGIFMNDGGLPENDDEIAIEADLLSSMGYSYELGQKINIAVEFTSGDEVVYAYETFTLCGVIKEYTDIWSVSGAGSNCLLNSAIITEGAAKALLAQAQEQMVDIEQPVVSYFFSAKSGYTGSSDSIKSEVNSYLKSSQRTVIMNSAVSAEQTEASYNLFYTILILLVALFAAVVIYVLNIQAEVQRIVRLRSLGASKIHVVLLVTIETLILSVPATAFGTALGAAGIKLLLKLSLYTGSVAVVVSIPLGLLLGALAVWCAGILLVRILTLQVALAAPLTGRMTMKVSSKRRSIFFQRILIVLLSAIMSTAIVFTVITSSNPLDKYKTFSSCASYIISGYENTISDSTIEQMLAVPCISAIRTHSIVTGCSLVSESGNLVPVNFLVIGDTNWKSLDFSKIDEDAFFNGECVLFVASDEQKDFSPEAGESITLSLNTYEYAVNIYGNMHTSDEATPITVESTVGAINIYNDYLTDVWTESLSYDLIIVCSKTFLQNIVDSIPSGYLLDNQCGGYKGGEEVNFTVAEAYTDSNAEYLSTDAVLANVVSNNGLQLLSMREIYDTAIQTNLQQLIFIIVSGVCIALVVLLILVSTLRLETESEKKRYGILQAIGMSKRQRNLELARRAVVRSVIAITAAVVSYLAYYLVMNITVITSGTSPIAVLNTMFTTLAGYGLTVPVLLAILAAVFLITFAICFGSKLGINKYKIMEMLRND